MCSIESFYYLESEYCREYVCYMIIFFKNSVDITFCFANGEQRTVKGRIGDSLKDTANAFHLPIPGLF